MEEYGVKLRLALSQNGSILCTAHNRSDNEVGIKHSTIFHHTDLYIFDDQGKSVAFTNRVIADGMLAKEKNGHPVTVPAGERAHLSHSRLLFDNDGTWGLTWGRMRYRGLKRGVYRFVACHNETLASNIAVFDINPIHSVIKDTAAK